MSKDYITIIDDKGKEIQMEVVSTFKLVESDKDIIIYKNVNLNDNHYFVASYNPNNEVTELNTNFSEKEQDEIRKIFEALMGGIK